MLLVSVAKVLVLNDDHVSIADFFEGAKAQGADAELSHNHTAATTTKKEQAGTGREEEKIAKLFLMTALNITQLLRKKFITCEPVVVKLWGSLQGTYRLVRPRMISRFSKGLSEFMLSGHV